MSVKIRLKRMGSMKRPFYRIIVADSRAPRDGKFIDTLGYYNPCVEPIQLKIDSRACKALAGKRSTTHRHCWRTAKAEGLLAREEPRTGKEKTVVTPKSA